MPKYSNRTTLDVLVQTVVYDEATVTFYTSGGSFTVPRNTLTERISEDDYPYTIEYHTPTNVITGVTASDGTLLYRIDDNQAIITSRNPVFLSKIIKNGAEVPLEKVIESMMLQISPLLRERLRTLPEEYLKLYFAYEVKVSYLASNPEQPFIFDPTPSEKMHAVALKSIADANFPGFFMKSI